MNKKRKHGQFIKEMLEKVDKSKFHLYVITKAFNDGEYAFVVFIIFSKGFIIIHSEKKTDDHFFCFETISTFINE